MTGSQTTFLGCIAIVLIWPLSIGNAHAQAFFAYPTKGQSAAQEKTDRAACHDWAVSKSGYDPTYKGNLPSGGKGAVGGTVLGGALGTIVGGIAGGVGTGAAIGAISGGLIGGIKGSSKRERADARYSAYLRAGKACMEAKGYQVK